MKEKKLNKKNLIRKITLILIIIALIVILNLIFRYTFKNLKNKKEFENNITSFANKNEKTIFSIDKIIFFSSCDSKNKTSSKTNFTIENLYAYTDISIFINNQSNQKDEKEILINSNEEENTNKNTAENTLKNVKITNITFTKQSELGNGNLYYKNVKNFAKSEIKEENKIDTELQFETTSASEADLDKPILYNNCANPITLSYINQNIKTDYTMTDTQNPITYNGKLLKRCGVSTETINASISFDIEIENNKNQKFKTTVYFDIPYENEEKSINDGSIIVEKETNFKFYRYE